MVSAPSREQRKSRKSERRQTVPASFVIGPKRNCSPASAAILPATLPIPNRPPYAFSEPEVINREIISFGSHYVGFINGQKESSGSLAREAVSFFASSTFRRLRPDRVSVTTSILMTALWAPFSGNVSVIFPGEKFLRFARPVIFPSRLASLRCATEVYFEDFFYSVVVPRNVWRKFAKG